MFINIILFILGYILIYNMFSKNYKFLVIALFQVIFLSLWAHLSTFFIDSQNGIYAIELMKFIDVDHSSSYRMIFLITFLVGVMLFFNEKRRNHLERLYDTNSIIDYKFFSFKIETIVKILFSIFLFVVLLDILSKPIPLFSSIGKGEYYINFASPIVKYFYTYGTFISFFIGYFIFITFRKKNVFDLVFLFLFFEILLIFLLLGNKFSALFTSLCFFLIPLSLITLSKEKIFPKINLKFVRFTALVLFIFIAYNFFSYFFLNPEWSPTYGLAMFGNRLLIQQGQIFSSTFSRVVDLSIIDSSLAFFRVFKDPVYNLESNTSLHFLMFQDIGINTYTQIEAGYGFTSDLSAILLELFGPTFALVIYFLFSLLLAFVLYLILCSILKYKYITVFFGIFVYHSIALSIIGGKLTYFCCGEISMMYGLKVFLFVLAYYYEEFLLKKINFYNYNST